MKEQLKQAHYRKQKEHERKDKKSMKISKALKMSNIVYSSYQEDVILFFFIWKTALYSIQN